MRSNDLETWPTMPRNDEEALQRLAQNIQDGTALFAIYNKHKKSIDSVLWRCLGEEGRSKKALDAIVDRIILRAPFYDARLETGEDWILREVTEEAQSLQRLMEQGNDDGNEMTGEFPQAQDDAR